MGFILYGTQVLNDLDNWSQLFKSISENGALHTAASSTAGDGILCSLGVHEMFILETANTVSKSFEFGETGLITVR